MAYTPVAGLAAYFVCHVCHLVCVKYNIGPCAMVCCIDMAPTWRKIMSFDMHSHCVVFDLSGRFLIHSYNPTFVYVDTRSGTRFTELLQVPMA